MSSACNDIFKRSAINYPHVFAKTEGPMGSVEGDAGLFPWLRVFTLAEPTSLCRLRMSASNSPAGTYEIEPDFNTMSRLL